VLLHPAEKDGWANVVTCSGLIHRVKDACRIHPEVSVTEGDGLEIHRALAAGVRIPSVSFSVDLGQAGLKSLRLEASLSQPPQLCLLSRPLHAPVHPHVHASVRPCPRPHRARRPGVNPRRYGLLADMTGSSQYVKRHRGEANPSGLSPLDLESIPAAARTKLH
jgi:hypothetical protein